MNTTLLKVAFENNLKIDLKLAENIITIARGIDSNLADEMEETLKQETRKGMAGYDYSVDSNIVGSDLDIRNHETFDASQVANCVICRKPLTNKKSISIAMGGTCSGLNYANEVNWNTVIEKLTSERLAWSYKYGGNIKVPPKYYAFKNVDVKIVAKHKSKKYYIISIEGNELIVPAFEMVYVPKMTWDRKEKIDENKRMTKSNTKFIKEENQETLLIQSKFIDKVKTQEAENLRAILRSTGLLVEEKKNSIFS